MSGLPVIADAAKVDSSATTFFPKGIAHKTLINIYLYPAEGAPLSFNKRKIKLDVLHCHIAVWAAVSEGAPLFLEGDEIPYSHHGVFRHIEVEELHARKGFESTQLAGRAGEVFRHKKAICGGTEPEKSAPEHL